MTLTKLCGMRTSQHVQSAAAAGADMIGVVGVTGSKRHVGSHAAGRLAEEASSLGLVPVLVLTADQLLNMEALPHFSVVQVVHAASSQLPQLVDAAHVLRTELVVVTSVVPGREHEVQIPELARPHFDTASKLGGGSGVTFDISALVAALGPQVLSRSVVAGGLTPENVGAVISESHPYAVDVASGIERSGTPNAELMLEFVRAVHAASTHHQPQESAT